jgi:hypothetical protein
MEDLFQLIESTANMLRGMTMDPAIPQHAKECLKERIAKLDKAVEDYAD